ncbi:hypothetical protein OCH239_12295 [Roseivivax halodurans JCM 10272]|uniref:Uncharacterized protein n=1 Tax=Roseivivax halodurans JCM 10272 TaxID=1449350 RepID=X7EDL3_9RHOB|nr:hypothetical protein OCH239_12295 [Roseivivax halodurans JCM 10272]
MIWPGSGGEVAGQSQYRRVRSARSRIGVDMLPHEDQETGFTTLLGIE